MNTGKKTNNTVKLGTDRGFFAVIILAIDQLHVAIHERTLRERKHRTASFPIRLSFIIYNTNSK